MSVLPAQSGQASSVKKGEKKDSHRGISSQNSLPKENPSSYPYFCCSSPVHFSSAEEHSKSYKLYYQTELRSMLSQGLGHQFLMTMSTAQQL